MEGIILNAKTTDGGAATATLVTQALRSKRIFVFGELLALPQVQKMRQAPTTSPVLSALEIFAYGTFSDYARTPGLPELNEAQILKLRQLTVVSLASKSKTLDYAQIIKETGVTNMREAEDLVIACVYDDLLKARLDQRNQKVHVQWCVARDVRPATIDEMLGKLNTWCNSADDVLRRIDHSLNEATKQRQLQQMERKIVNEEAERMKIQIMRESSDSTIGKIDSAATATSSKRGGGGAGQSSGVGMMASFFGRRS